MATSLHEGPTNQLDLLIRAGKHRGTFLRCIRAAGEGAPGGRGASPGAVSARVRCPSPAAGWPRRGGVNEVMEATNQEVITLESNLPRIRAVAPGSAAAAGAGHGAAAKLGSRRGRVARFTPVAGEPGSERSCCPRRLPRCPAERPPLPTAGGAGRPPPSPHTSHSRHFRMDAAAPGATRQNAPGLLPHPSRSSAGVTVLRPLPGAEWDADPAPPRPG